MKQDTLFKYGVTRKVEHRGNVVDVSGIYSCICDKHFKTKAGLSMHQAWCKEVVPTAKGQNANKITATNFSKTKPDVMTKEVQIVLDEMLDNITDKQSANIATEERRGAIERKSYGNCFKMRVISACKRNQLTDHDIIAFQFGIDKTLVSKWKKQEKKISDAA